MSDSLQHRPQRRLWWWLAALVLVAFSGAAWVAFNHGRPRAESAADLERIAEAASGIGRSQLARVRTEIGDERFWRAVKEGIRGRPADWEAGILERLTQKGREPAWLQMVMVGPLSPLEERWSRQDDWLSAALKVIKWNLEETTSLPDLPELVSLAGSRHDNYAMRGIQILRAAPANAASALPVLFRRLERAASLASLTVEAIQAIDPEGDQSTLQFVELLPKVTAYQRSEILPVLGSRARRHPELATNLWPALQHPDQNVVGGGIRGLSRAGLLTAAYLEPHRAGFHSDDAHTRWLSLNLVAHAGVNAAGFVPELRAVGLRKGPDQYTALAGLRMVLFSKGPPTEQRFAAAEAILASDSANDALVALDHLYPFGTGWPQVTLITGALVHPDVEVRAEAARRLGEMGPAARSALPQLRALRQDPEKRVRDAVELALPKLGE